jgi:uncharacterized protein YecT (DUF1311 family)
MNRTFVAPLLLAAVAFASPALSAEDDIDCDNANSTVEMNFCADKDFAAADRALNAAYRSVLTDAKKRDVEPPYDAKHFEDALRASQRAWVAYRDADCKDLVAQEWSGGTGTTSAVLGCMTEKTKQRTKDLKERFEAK